MQADYLPLTDCPIMFYPPACTEKYYFQAMSAYSAYFQNLVSGFRNMRWFGVRGTRAFNWINDRFMSKDQT